jgi:hypothetical protein
MRVHKVDICNVSTFRHLGDHPHQCFGSGRIRIKFATWIQIHLLILAPTAEIYYDQRSFQRVKYKWYKSPELKKATTSLRAEGSLDFKNN